MTLCPSATDSCGTFDGTGGGVDTACHMGNLESQRLDAQLTTEDWAGCYEALGNTEHRVGGSARLALGWAKILFLLG